MDHMNVIKFSQTDSTLQKKFGLNVALHVNGVIEFNTE